MTFHRSFSYLPLFSLRLFWLKIELEESSQTAESTFKTFNYRVISLSLDSADHTQDERFLKWWEACTESTYDDDDDDGGISDEKAEIKKIRHGLEIDGIKCCRRCMPLTVLCTYYFTSHHHLTLLCSDESEVIVTFITTGERVGNLMVCVCVYVQVIYRYLF